MSGTTRCGSVLLLALLACGDSREAGPPPSATASAVAELATTIGVLDGPEEYLFGDVSAVAADTAGRIYVADLISSTVRVYDASGAFLAQIGRQGAGPGEFTKPYDMTFGPDGRLYVREAYRISVLATSAAGVPDSLVAVMPHEGYPYHSARRGAVDTAGRYYDPNYRYPSHSTGLPPQYVYRIHSPGSLEADSLRVPEYHNIRATRRAYYMVTESSGRLVRGLSHAPFEPVPSWVVTPRGTILGGDGERYDLFETDARGDTVRTITGPRPRQAVPEAAMRDSAAALAARLDTLPVPLPRLLGASDAVRARELPDSLPAFVGVHLGEDGRIWVEQWPPRSDARHFDVLAPNGELEESVEFSVPLLREPPPWFARDAIYGVVQDTATGIERVVKLAIRRTAG
jgi:hypothetical protein